MLSMAKVAEKYIAICAVAKGDSVALYYGRAGLFGCHVAASLIGFALVSMATFWFIQLAALRYRFASSIW